MHRQTGIKTKPRMDEALRQEITGIVLVLSSTELIYYSYDIISTIFIFIYFKDTWES